jgi:hypothetical protein
MSNYKINIDKPTPTKDETSKFKNFDNVVDDYKKMHSPWILLKEMYRNKKLIRIFIVLMAILVAVFFGTHTPEKHEGIDEKVEDVKKKIDVNLD